MNKLQRRLATGLNTANNWSSDTGSGRGLLSLGTSRQLHSEDHRASCLKDIDGDILWNRGRTEASEVNDPARDIPLLEDLRDLVTRAPVGVPWLTDGEFNRLVEVMYQGDTLGVLPKGKTLAYPEGWA